MVITPSTTLVMAPKKRLPKQGVDGLPSSLRQRSLSSASESSSPVRKSVSTAAARPRRKQDLGPAQADLPTSTSEQAGLETLSHDESPSTMRTSSTPFEGPLTYTPTTHRISKAKKGKRVHACESPGCGKVSGDGPHHTGLPQLCPLLFDAPDVFS